jgi:hypothetical protein
MVSSAIWDQFQRWVLISRRFKFIPNCTRKPYDLLLITYMKKIKNKMEYFVEEKAKISRKTLSERSIT